MRARTGCQACRERHIKCIRDNPADRCQKCIENDRSCYQTARHRFRPVTSVNLKTDDDRTIKQNLVYDPSQKWVDIPSQVEFVDDHKDNGMSEQSDSTQVEAPKSERSIATTIMDKEVQGTAKVIDVPANDFFSTPEIAHQATVPGRLMNGASISAMLNSPEDTVGTLALKSPSHTSKRSHSDVFESPMLFNPTTTPNMGGLAAWPFHTRREAQLFHYYVKSTAPWVDVLDPLEHFGKEVPRRVPFYPILANAIYALSARHMAMLTNSDDSDSPHYADNCLQILIKSIDDPFAHWDENLLVAVVILRLHEELSHDDDIRCHLFGTRKMLDSVSAFAADGGLREAASWVSLRQHIYVSLTEQQPLDITLQNFRHSAVFNEGSTRNEDWSNRIVFIFGTILDYAFGPALTPAPERWHELEAEVRNWYDTKPWDFAPLWQNLEPETRYVVSTPASVPGTATTPKDAPPSYLARTDSINSYPIKPWPELLMAHRAQVTGLQYYHLARVVLAIYDPTLTRLGFGSLRARKQCERIVLDGVRHIVGLASSNEDVTNAIFEASHILKTCGGYLKDEGEQNAAVAFLERAQQRMGWTTSKTIAELRTQWSAEKG